jgi:Tfp pilus assembly protein PilV
MAQIGRTIMLKGTTLLEALIAMVMLLICILVSAGVINNLLQSSSSADKLKAEVLLNKWMNETIEQSNFMDEESGTNNFRLTKKVLRLQEYDDIISVQLTATNEEGRKVGEKKMLIKTSP